MTSRENPSSRWASAPSWFGMGETSDKDRPPRSDPPLTARRGCREHTESQVVDPISCRPGISHLNRGVRRRIAQIAPELPFTRGAPQGPYFQGEALESPSDSFLKKVKNS